MLAQRGGAWVPLDEVPDVWEGVTSLFRDYGYRRLRSKARLKFLIRDWGIEKFREILEHEYLKRPLIDGPPPPPVIHPIDHVGVQRQKNGRNAIGVSPIAGRVSGTILSAVADLMERAGSDRARLTPYQKLVILDVPDENVDEMVAALDALGLPSRPSHWRNNLMACSGIEFCKLSFAETRVRAQTLVPELEKRLEDINSQLDEPITVYINGCPNSCARIQIADIGFKGQMVDDGHGGSVEVFQWHLGGSLGAESGFGRKLRQHKVFSHELGDYVDRVVRNFVNQRHEGERLATCAMRGAEENLRRAIRRKVAPRHRYRRWRRAALPWMAPVPPTGGAGPRKPSATTTWWPPTCQTAYWWIRPCILIPPRTPTRLAGAGRGWPRSNAGCGPRDHARVDRAWQCRSAIGRQHPRCSR